MQWKTLKEPLSCQKESDLKVFINDNLPVKVSRPGEPSDLEVNSVSVVVLHGLVVDDVDDGHDEGLAVVFDTLQQRPKPVLNAIWSDLVKEVLE